MTEYEYYQVGYKRFKSENPDGSGKILVLEDKVLRVPVTDGSAEGIMCKKLYREVKAGINK